MAGLLYDRRISKEAQNERRLIQLNALCVKHQDEKDQEALQQEETASTLNSLKSSWDFRQEKTSTRWSIDTHIFALLLDQEVGEGFCKSTVRCR